MIRRRAVPDYEFHEYAGPVSGRMFNLHDAGTSIATGLVLIAANAKVSNPGVFKGLTD